MPRRMRGPITDVAQIRECSRDVQRCKEATNMRKRTPGCCRRVVAELAAELFPEMTRVGLRWWVDYGSALGFATNGGLYWNDKDLDVGVLALDRELALDVLMPRMRELGMRVSYSKPKAERFGGGDRMKVRISEANDTNCDIFFWEIRRPQEVPGSRGGKRWSARVRWVLDRNNYIWVDRYKGREFPVEWALAVAEGSSLGDADTPPVLVASTETGLWEGETPIMVPMQLENLVRHRYGPSWRGGLPAARHDGRMR